MAEKDFTGPRTDEAVNPVEIEAEKRIDAVRDLIDDLSAADLLKRFERLEAALPQPLSAKSKLRLGLNKGLCLLRMGKQEDAARAFLAAYEHAPDDPRAVAHKILGHWFLGDTGEACSFGEIALACDPDNALAAFYFVQAQADLPDCPDPLAGVPAALRAKAMILTAEIMVLRRRERSTVWCARARAAADLHPDDDDLRALAAIAAVEQVTSDDAVHRTRTLNAEQTASLREAIEPLDKAWRAVRGRLEDAYDMGVQYLGAALVCARLLGDDDKLSEMLTVIDKDGLKDPGLIATAVRVLENQQCPELFDRLTARAIDDPIVAFQVGLELVQRGDLGGGAELLARAAVPPEEHAPVAVLQRIVELAAGGVPISVEDLEALRTVAVDDPRALILISQSAREAGHEELAESAYGDALTLAKASRSIAYRATVAARAHNLDRPSDVVDLLDGLDAVRRDDRMLLMLARAHAAERPRRVRNLCFFQTLPELTDAQYEIACHRGSLYAALDRPETVDLAQGLMRQRPDDAFAVALLVTALRSAHREAELPDALGAIKLEGLSGSIEHRFIAIHAFRRAGQVSRALRAAYAIVTGSPNNEQAVTGYISLHWSHLFEGRGDAIFDEPERVGVDCWVKLRSQLGVELAFIIGHEAQVPGAPVFAPTHALAAASMGLVVGDTFEREEHLGLSAKWTVEEFKSKYLFLWQHFLQDFNQRFPSSRVIMSVPMVENDISTVENIMRNRHDVMTGVLNTYTNGDVPLAMCARVLQSDPLSFAQSVRERGGVIRTSVGLPIEQGEAWSVGRSARGRGVVLDPYTAVVAARIGLLAPLRRYFGHLLTTTSTLRLLDGIIDRGAAVPDDGLWQLGWADGGLRSENTSAEVAARHYDLIARVRADIVEHCTVEAVLMPDDASPDLVKWNETVGPRVMDSLSLAIDRSVPLLSDDLPFRNLAVTVAGVRGLWLYASLSLCLEAGDIDLPSFVRAAAGLARHRHKHALLTLPMMRVAFDLGSADDLADFRALCCYLGGKDMDEWQHAGFIVKVWLDLWRAVPHADPAAVKRALFAMLDNYTRGAGVRIPILLCKLRHHLPFNYHLADQVSAWARGRFLMDQTGALIDPPSLGSNDRGRPQRRRLRSRETGSDRSVA